MCSPVQPPRATTWSNRAKVIPGRTSSRCSGRYPAYSIGETDPCSGVHVYRRMLQKQKVLLERATQSPVQARKKPL